MLTVMANSIYNIEKSPVVDVDLYGILLIPEKAKYMLSKEQNLIIDMLVEKFPIIYEEGRCKQCEQFYIVSSELRNKYKSDNNDDIEKTCILNKIHDNSKKISKHRETHGKFTADIIDKISGYFIECRDKIQETVSIGSDSNESNDKVLVYNPNRQKIVTRRLF